ncbi:ROK family protein, partial [Streptomyces sp. NPDC059409]|uniref:ROK family protein n=1 Tax=Streptomyces sp. NPDC059409 TaxID=3346824 RepID=UPI003680ADA3
VCAVDLRARVRARAVRIGSNRGRSPEPVLEQLTGLVGQVVSEAETEGLWPAGLAVAVPGLVARDGRTVVRAPNLDWHDADLGALLPADLPLTVDNEANFGALAELWLGDGTPRDFLHVSAEIGIGAAVVFDGRLLRGTRGFAGELGHVPVRPDGPECPCGGRGCLEQYAGEKAVLRAAGVEPGEDRVGLLAGRATEGDDEVRRAQREAGTALGIALTGAVNLLDPEGVVLGGALAGLAPWLVPSLREELAGRTAGSACPVAVSELGPQGPLLGAAHSVVRAVLDDPGAVAERA